MNTSNPDTLPEALPDGQETAPSDDAAGVSAQAPAAPAPIPQADNRRRQLRDLLSIPERDRTDDQWDQIIELEIQLAPGNRVAPNEHAGSGPARHHGKPSGGGGGGGNNSGQQKKHRPRQGQGGNNRRPRGGKPGGNNPA